MNVERWEKGEIEMRAKTTLSMHSCEIDKCKKFSHCMREFLTRTHTKAKEILQQEKREAKEGDEEEVDKKEKEEDKRKEENSLIVRKKFPAQEKFYRDFAMQ